MGDIAGLAMMIKGSVALVGAEAFHYGELITKELGLSSADIRTVEAVPNGATVALLAARRLEYGEGDDVLSLTPLYLKESTAKVFRNKYLRRGQD